MRSIPQNGAHSAVGNGANPRKIDALLRRVHADVIVDVDVAFDVASQGLREGRGVLQYNTISWSSLRTANGTTVEMGENHPARRVYRPRIVSAAQRRDASQGFTVLHLSGRAQAEPSWAERLELKQKRESVCTGKKLGVVLADAFLFGPRIVIDIISALLQQYVVL